MKKRLSIVLCIAMIIMIVAGCSGQTKAPAASAAAPSASAAAPASASAAPSASAAAPASAASSDVIKDFGGKKVVMGFMVGNTTQPGKERVFGKINKYFKDTYNIDLEIQYALLADYAQTINMMLASGEQMDIFNAGQVGFTVSVANQSCYDLYKDDLVKKYGKGALDVVNSIDPVWLRGTTVDGHLYGIPLMRDMATGLWNIVFAKKYLDGINYDFSKIDTEACNKATSQDMTDLFAKLHAKYPGVNVIFPWGYQYLAQKLMYDPIGGDVFGVLLDPAKSLEVSDLFSSDMFKQYCDLMYSWAKAGYISKDAVTETQGGGAQIMAGTLMADTTGGKPGIVRQKEVERGDLDSISFQLGEDFAQSGLASVAAWALNSNTEVPEAAMTVLDNFYTNATVTNLIMWGEENVDYVFTADKHVTFPQGVTKDNAQYYNFVPSWALPCEYTVHIGVGYPIDRWEQEKTFNKNALKSKAIGFSFDSTPVKAEYTALQNVWLEYANGLLFGQVDPAVGIPELQKRLKAAGLDKYIEAKRTALNAWAAKNNIK